MDQHPVPQNITGYQFRLVGDMTLKQFGFLGGGAVIALLFYYSPFPGFFKFPFVIVFALGGIGLAFLPINDIPLDRWVVAFFKAIYSPTKFYWRKEEKTPDFLTYQPVKAKVAPAPTPVTETAKLSEYLGSIVSQESSALDKTETELVSNLTRLLEFTIPTSPNLTPTTPKPSINTPEIKTQSTPQANYPPQPPTPIPISHRGPSSIPTEISGTSHKSSSETVTAKFSSTIPIPRTPENPNVIVGMVLSTDGKIIENAILEIRDALGHPVRTLRTSKIGQFSVAIPLKNGSYVVEVEKDGFSFDIIRFEAKGEIIPPIEIRAKNPLN